ncbi:hypothetical protein OF83DRAFT_888530 [Amylostereum chailletii]|nr:hypothetical protein OF83DRAFT_888530 [Amylostereum chailletii]
MYSTMDVYLSSRHTLEPPCLSVVRVSLLPCRCLLSHPAVVLVSARLCVCMYHSVHILFMCVLLLVYSTHPRKAWDRFFSCLWRMVIYRCFFVVCFSRSSFVTRRADVFQRVRACVGEEAMDGRKHRSVDGSSRRPVQ